MVKVVGGTQPEIQEGCRSGSETERVPTGLEGWGRVLGVLAHQGCSRNSCQDCVRAHARVRLCRAGAVVGVSLFSHSVPEAFGAFDVAFMTLFYVTGGDPWPDSLPKNNEDG